MGKLATKYKGIEVEFLDGEVFVLPRASLRIIVNVQAKTKDNPDIANDLSFCAELLCECFRMNYPSFNNEYLFDNLSFEKINEYVEYVTGLSNKKEEEIKKK